MQRYIVLMGGPFKGLAHKTEVDENGKPVSKWLHCAPAYSTDAPKLGADQWADIVKEVALYKRQRRRTRPGGFTYWVYQFTDPTEAIGAVEPQG